MGGRGPPVLLVVGAVTRQPDLFGGVHTVDDQPHASREINDVDLIHTVAANAIRCGYVLVGAAERVYVRTVGDEVARVPRYEEDAVHQLLRRRWLTTGASHALTCGAASLTGIALLVPKQTRAAVARWNHLQRPPSWPQQPATTPDLGRAGQDTRVGRVVRLDDKRRRR
jgi:hypothetical protein